MKNLLEDRNTLIILIIVAAVALLIGLGCFFFFFASLLFDTDTPGTPPPGPEIGVAPEPVINHPVEGITGQPVTFDGSESRPGSSPITSYEWVFGDGSTGEGATVTHTYDDPGVYQVTLTVTGEDGLSNTGGPVQITINEPGPAPTPTMTQLPQPVINYPPEARVGQQVTFDGSQSVPGGNPIDSFEWSFGDGNGAEGPVVTHIYNNPGLYQVTLTVTDEQGFGNVATVEIRINEAEPEPGAPPQAVINYPTQVSVGEQATFDGSQSIPGSSPIIGYEWAFGDGDSASGSRVTHVYDDPGTYEVSLTVTAADDQRNTARVRIEVFEEEPIPTPEPTATPEPEPDEPPQAIINAPAQAEVGESVTLDGNQSVQGSNPIDSYVWDFGDGNGGSGAVVEHTYNLPGTFDILLTVTDSAGLSNTAGPTKITITGEPQPAPQSE